MQPDYLMTGNIGTMNTPDELLQAYTALFLFLGGSVSMSPGESGLPHLCDAGLLRNLPVGSTSRVKLRPNGYGKAVYLTTPDGVTYVYGHLGRLADGLSARVRAVAPARKFSSPS